MKGLAANIMIPIKYYWHMIKKSSFNSFKTHIQLILNFPYPYALYSIAFHVVCHIFKITKIHEPAFSGRSHVYIELQYKANGDL